MKGGKSYQKLGFADVNLAKFAGAGKTAKRYLLEGYDSKKRQDNSMLKVNIDTTLLSGDPCFKVPKSESLTMPGEAGLELPPENKGAADEEHSLLGQESNTSESSGFDSLPRKEKTSLPVMEGATGLTTELLGARASLKPSDEKQGGSQENLQEKQTLSDPGHSRSSSYTSQQSKVSGYSSSKPGNHSRQSSSGSFSTGHIRNPSVDSGKSEMTTGGRHKKGEQFGSLERRVDFTRVNNDELIDELIEKHRFDISEDDSAETSGLQLYVAKDGSTALSSQQLGDTGKASRFEAVVIKR